MTVKALCVDPARIEEIWPHVSAFIEEAFWHERGDDSAEIVLADLQAERALLWIVWDDDDKQIIAAATTKLLHVRGGLVCLITSCCGNDLHRWQQCILEIEIYAKAEGCSRVRIDGRLGWRRYFPDYRERWVVLEKTLI